MSNRKKTKRFAVACVLFASTKIVEAPGEAVAKTIVENVSNDELMNDAEADDIVPSVTPLVIYGPHADFLAKAPKLPGPKDSFRLNLPGRTPL